VRTTNTSKGNGITSIRREKFDTLLLDVKVKEHRLRVLRRIFGPEREEVAGDWRKLHMRNFITCTFHQL
jgi:hypothetical protein